MPKEITKILFLNQMAGPLFRELAEDLADSFSGVSVLKTGHPDTIAIGSFSKKLLIEAYPGYNRKTYLSRVISWLKYTFLVSIAMFRLDNNTAIFIVSNPPLLGPAAWLVNKLKGVPYIILVYDMHPDTMVSFGLLRESSITVRIWRWVNIKVWNNAEGVYTLGPVMSEKLSAQFNVKNTRLNHVEVIPPWADTDKIKPIKKYDNPLLDKFGQRDKVTILYSGNMGISHDIDSILQAAKISRNNEKISFLLIGEGEKWQDALDFKIRHKLNNLHVMPFQSEDMLPFTMSLADIAIVALDSGAEGLMIPSKMFYYMAAGAAVVGISNGRNDVSEIIDKSNCGISVPPRDPDNLAKVIADLANNVDQLDAFKNNSRKAAEST
jgi:glycosyltransferase involved in cell wall biosynthesis